MLNNLFKNLCWIAIFFPFASPMPVNTDVQPLVFILIIITFFINKYKIKINYFSIALLIFSLISITYININFEYQLIKRFGFLAILILIIFLSAEINNYKNNLVNKILIVHILLLLIQLLIPNYFSLIFSGFIRNETFSEGDVRGVHGLNAEPGGAAAVLCGVYFYLIISSYKEQLISESYQRIILFTCLIGLSLTKSGLSIYCSILIIIYHIIMFRSDRLIILIVTAIITSYFSYYNENNRAIGLIISLNESGLNILVSDGSIAERMLGLFYGIYSLTISPFGFGGGGYPIASKYVEDKFLLSNYFYSARDQIDGSISMTGLYLAEYGVFYCIFFIILLYYFRPKKISSLPIFMLGISFFMFSFSVAFPITWLLFYLVRANNKEG
jgi:hypothetical protein